MTVDGPVVGVVGTGIAGLQSANAVLERNPDARIVIFGDETHRTYNRPGLTKKRYQLLTSGTTITDELKVDGAASDSATWRLGTRVESADLYNKVLQLRTGETFDYDSLVIATGVRPRISAEDARECAIHMHKTLRDLDDAHHIHRDLRTGTELTIVGSGFVACELASLATEYGCAVAMLEARRRGPFERVLGERIATALGRWMTRNGVTFLTGDSARDRLCNGDSSAHSEPSSDRSLLVEAIGSVPNVEWLHGNGLDLSDGVRVDEHMRVPECADVYAAGDVARYPDPWTAESLTRREFWKNAIDTGDLAGRSLASSLGCGSKISHIRYFPLMSTEVFGLRIQIAGNPKAATSMEVVRGDLDRLDHGVVVTFSKEDLLVGVAYLDKGARLNSIYIDLVKTLKAHRR
ncbi:NADPH-dependent 2,4-dienoyl-CoA reductase/sulfur reductase-like enzyme [Actinopolyspora lacussalsi]|nr:NADPH-dependent 2,4-dienoyl-CoA reductase/sulfur reductase-like enzyme [Actinopolyspora lacussalsi]